MVEESNKAFAFIITQGIVRAKATLQSHFCSISIWTVAPAVVSNRTAYATAMGLGSSACLFDKQAEVEIQQVWNFVKARLFEEQNQIKRS